MVSPRRNKPAAAPSVGEARPEVVRPGAVGRSSWMTIDGVQRKLGTRNRGHGPVNEECPPPPKWMIRGWWLKGEVENRS